MVFCVSLHAQPVVRMISAKLGAFEYCKLLFHTDLGFQKIRRHRVNALHALGVLRRQGGDRRHAVATERGDGLHVGLNARAAAAVGAGNGQNAHIAMGQAGVLHEPNYAQRKGLPA